MLPTHQEVAQHAGYTIYQRKPGFEFTPTTLRKFASYLVRGPDEQVAVFAFSYSPVDGLTAAPLSEAGLLDQALQHIEQYLDAQPVTPRREYTFEYRQQDRRFVEVLNPPWWLPSFS